MPYGFDHIPPRWIIEEDTVIINWGRYTGLSLDSIHDMDPGYLDWLLRAPEKLVPRHIKKRIWAMEEVFRSL